MNQDSRLAMKKKNTVQFKTVSKDRGWRGHKKQYMTIFYNLLSTLAFRSCSMATTNFVLCMPPPVVKIY